MSAGRDETGEFGGPCDEPQNKDEFALIRREQKVRSEFWDKFKRVAQRIPFAENLLAVYYCAMDSRTPLRVRSMLLGALAYFIVPIDAIPDIIAGLGFTDDAAVLATVISLVARHIQPRHRAAAAKALGKQPPEEDTEST